MIIKIKQASKPTYWYADKIGEQFDVIKESFNIQGRLSYHVGYGINEGLKDELHVFSNDCEVIS